MVEQAQMMYITMHREYYDKLVSWCRNYISNDPELVDCVEDWVQEAFYRALKDRKFPTHPNKYGWFLLTCTHLAESAMQRKGVRHKHISIHLNAPGALPAMDPLASVDGWMDEEELWALMEECYNRSQFRVYAKISYFDFLLAGNLCPPQKRRYA